MLVLIKYYQLTGLFIYMPISAISPTTAQSFARAILDETGIAVTPGQDFDAVRGKHFLRFSYARSLDDMQEAVKRLKPWIKNSMKFQRTLDPRNAHKALQTLFG